MRRLAFLTVMFCAGCASYSTPGGPAPLAAMAAADAPNATLAPPTLSFPVSVSLIRVQAPDYESFSAQALASGSFSVVEPEPAALLKSVSQWPLVAQAGVLGTRLLPPQLESLDDLRLAAAKNRADVLIVYTMDTRFESDGRTLEPLADVSLGKAPEQGAGVASQASALFIDVRTGYRYGVARAGARIDDLADAWTSAGELDRRRVDAEHQAAEALLTESAKLWGEMTGQNRFAGG